jgi:hypothetical protein
MTSELREVFRSFNITEADLVSSRLASAGLHPSVQNAQSTLWLEGGGVAGGSARVVVPAAEYEEATRFLATDSDE